MAKTKVKTVIVKMREDQARLFSKWLGDQYVAQLPEESAALIHQVHSGLRVIERHDHLHTLDLTGWSPAILIEEVNS